MSKVLCFDCFNSKSGSHRYSSWVSTCSKCGKKNVTVTDGSIITWAIAGEYDVSNPEEEACITS